MSASQPELSIIIVSWNVRELLERCLNSIHKFLDLQKIEIIVVDNASQDGSADMVQEKFSGVKLIKNSKNVGFGKANNQGMQKAKGNYFLLLNDDTELVDNHVMQGISYLVQHPEVGLLGMQLLNADLTPQASVRNFPTWQDQAMYVLKMHIIFPQSKIIKKYLATDFNYSQAADVEQLMGACLFLRSALAHQLGGFDERYPNWFEEVDLCQRIKKQDLHVRYVPLAKIIHVKGASFSQQRPLQLQRMYNYSMRQYFFKWRPRWEWLVICALQPISLCLAWLVGLAKKLGLNTAKLKPKNV